jgi:hypothetical protein
MVKVVVKNIEWWKWSIESKGGEDGEGSMT